MDPNRWEGRGKQIKGEVKDTLGKFTGDAGQQIEGKIDKGVGKAQDAYGRAKDELKDQVRKHQENMNQQQRHGGDATDKGRRSGEPLMDNPDL